MPLNSSSNFEKMWGELILALALIEDMPEIDIPSLITDRESECKSFDYYAINPKFSSFSDDKSSSMACNCLSSLERAIWERGGDEILMLVLALK